MAREITTEGIVQHTKKILEGFTADAKEAGPYTGDEQIYLMLGNKLVQNCASSLLLAAHGAYGDAKILIRSGFETLVLMAYLAKFPGELEEYKADQDISEFKSHYSLVKRGSMSVDTLVPHYYNEFSEAARKKLKVKGTQAYFEKNPFSFLSASEKALANPRQIKPLAQKTDWNLKKLRESKFLNFEQIEEFSFLLYRVNSQIAHGTLWSVYYEFSKAIDNKESHEKIKDCFRQAMLLLVTCRDVLGFIRQKALSYSWAGAGVEMFDYLGFDCERLKSAKETMEMMANNTSSLLYLPVKDPYLLDV